MRAASFKRAAVYYSLAAERPLPPPLLLGLVFAFGRLVVLWRGVGNVILQRPDRRGRGARRMLVVGRRGVDFVGHGAKAVGLVHKAGLGMLHAFRLGTFAPFAAATAATA